MVSGVYGTDCIYICCYLFYKNQWLFCFFDSTLTLTFYFNRLSGLLGESITSLLDIVASVAVFTTSIFVLGGVGFINKSQLKSFHHKKIYININFIHIASSSKLYLFISRVLALLL